MLDGAWLTLVAATAAALPVVVSTIRALADGVQQNGDRGIIALNAYDVLTSRTPLLGQFSASSLVVHQPIHSPGPMLYWLLALPARLGGSPALALVMGAFNAGAIALSVVIARRRGGTALMLLTAAAIALMCRSLFAEVYHDIWNPSAGILAFTLLIFICWSVASGSVRLLPAAVVVASYTAQCELTFVLPSVLMLLVAVIGLARHRPPRTRRCTLIALAAAAVCWLAPIAQQLTHRPGNLALTVRAASAGEPKLGAPAGWHALVHAIGVPPWWLRIPAAPFDRVDEIGRTPAILASVSAVLILLALLATVVIALGGRRPEIAAAAAISLVLSGALFETAAATPSRQILEASLGYTLWWASPAGMWVWLTLAWALAAALRPRLAWRPRLAAPAAIAGTLGAAAVGVSVAAAEKPDPDRVEYAPIGRVLSRVDGAVHRGTTYSVGGSGSFTAFDFKAAIMFELRRRGFRPVVLGARTRLSGWYDARVHPEDARLTVYDGNAPARAHVVARVAVPAAVDHTLTVTLERVSRPAPGRRAGAARVGSGTPTRASAG